MGMDQFPMFRLATLLARQLSSPIAARIKTHATRHPLFRRLLVERAGRVYRGAELRFKLWLLRLGRPPRAPPLSEKEATQVGADIIGEMIIFSLGAAIVVFEVNRQAVNKELKELDERSHWVAILVGLEELQREVALQQEDLDRLHAALRELAPQHLPGPAPRAKIPDYTPASSPTATPSSGSELTKSPDNIPASSRIAPSELIKSPESVPASSQSSKENETPNDNGPAPPHKRRPPYC